MLSKSLNILIGAHPKSLYSCGSVGLSIRFYSASFKLPNEVSMAEKLEPSLLNFKYDLVSNDWFEYHVESGQWRRLSKFQIDQKIFLILKSMDGIKDLLTTEYMHKVKTVLEMTNGLDFDSFRTRNKNINLIPFKNGVLDLFRIDLLPHGRDYFFTHGLNIIYDPSAKLSDTMINFLLSISNQNLLIIRVLRAFIQCILFRNNKYQVALYLYGPGGTGKSTFEKLMISLVGSNNSAILDLNELNRPFFSSKLIDKSLVLFSDVQAYTGDPSKLRLLISGDIMNAERKYKDSFDLQPEALVILSSNNSWNPKDSSTGLSRRVIYIPFETKPIVKDNNLFNYDLTSSLASGSLADSLPGLVNWALANPSSNLNLLSDSFAINNAISPNFVNDSNPLVDWIKSYLSYEPDSEVYLGTKSTDPGEGLFANYIQFCKELGYRPLPYNIFNSSLLQQLNQLLSPDIFKRRLAKGRVIVNIRLHKNLIVDASSSTLSNDNILAAADEDIMTEFKRFINIPPTPRYHN